MPSITASIATTSSTLFASSNASRDAGANAPGTLAKPNCGARHAYNARDTPITTAKKARMNAPRAGSVANACTLVSTPERTKKVPSNESEKAMMASNTVQLLKMPRFSVTANE